MLKALVISNGIGAEAAYPDIDVIHFETVTIGPDFSPDLTSYDLLIVPNGSDHVALHRIKDRIRAFLDAGKTVCCFCGWFTDWVPGHRWIHDNTHRTRDVRHLSGDDPHGLLKGVHVPGLDQNAHGIYGWWACGYIEPAPGADVLVHDTWGRALVLADTRSTPGFLFLTASGPIGDYSRYGDAGPLGRLYQNLLRFIIARQETSSAVNH